MASKILLIMNPWAPNAKTKKVPLDLLKSLQLRTFLEAVWSGEFFGEPEKPPGTGGDTTVAAKWRLSCAEVSLVFLLLRFLYGCLVVLCGL